MNTHKEKTKQRIVVPTGKERAHSSPLFYNHSVRDNRLLSPSDFSIPCQTNKKEVNN